MPWNEFPNGIIRVFHRDIPLPLTRHAQPDRSYFNSVLRLRIAEEIYSVSQVTRMVRRILEDGLPAFWVEGEVSNFHHHRSGHRYFTLKDTSAQLSCVMWRNRPAPGFDLADGALVRAFGRITVYEQGGRYQLDVQSLTPAGLGALQAAFEALKRKLAAEGLFEEARKKPLPEFPLAVGLVTSPTGAAIRDLVWGFSSRYPPAELYLLPVAVQGEAAAEQIAGAVRTFNRLGIVDVIVIGRGGGALEDLWAFNEEVVVRAVAESSLPVVSAVGHEVDITLSDLAADLRAPTPTAAAALVVPDRSALKETLSQIDELLRRRLSENLSRWRERLRLLAKGYGLVQVVRRIGGERQRLDELSRRQDTDIRLRLNEAGAKVSGFSDRLKALSPRNVFTRGFCIARDPAGVIIKDADQVAVDDNLRLSFHRGAAGVVVKEVVPADE